MRPQRPVTLIVTCEHGGNRIPAAFATLFQDQQWLLSTHRGYDAGALEMGRAIARAFHADFFASTISRLCVEMNRTPGHPAFRSTIMRAASAPLQRAAQRYYDAHHARVKGRVAAAVASGERVLHIASHSFTPRMNGENRRADAGLLYDPKRRWESCFCAAWQTALREQAPQWVVRRNYPYRGDSDGLTNDLRNLHSEASYCGIELEMNARLVRAGPVLWTKARASVIAALRALL
ncbi:MAG: N-formylglutamate amidohydrolase [Casimicrobiaceae bacterium]